MEADRTVQIFLSESTAALGVYEVIYTEAKKFICNCHKFISSNRCPHTKFVEDKVKNNGGTYPLEIAPEATKMEVLKAAQSADEFRKFLIKYAKIEVLDSNA